MRWPGFEPGSQRWQRRILTTKLPSLKFSFIENYLNMFLFYFFMFGRSSRNCENYLYFIFRVLIGLMFMQHGVQKLFG